MIDNNVTGTATIKWPGTEVVAGSIVITIAYDDGPSLVINATNMISCSSTPPAFTLTAEIKGVVDDESVLLTSNMTVNANIIGGVLALYLTGTFGFPRGYLSGQPDHSVNEFYGIASGAVSESGQE